MFDEKLFESLSLYQRLKFIDTTFGSRAMMLTSMQKPTCVLMHLLRRLKARVSVVFIDTGFHFSETLDLRDEYCRQFGINIVTVYPELTPEQQAVKYGGELYRFDSGQKRCCQLRKEEPFIRIAKLLGIQAVVAGLMRAEKGKRAHVVPIAFDSRISATVFHPLFDWTETQLDDYVAQFKLPLNELYAQGYASIGCAPCTTPIVPGEDKRAGRWRHLRQQQGQYCLLNQVDYQI